MVAKTVRGEVMCGGEKFTYVLAIELQEMRARVFRADGALYGWISCGIFPPYLEAEAQEAAALAWVEHCVVYRVGLP